ncbi:FMN-binding negative transcriptional regulator [Roseococcus pinisoli]|uniref:FMN-binding negative transcriptional regulator n=1 Tax=Roseococcus pinisoli TaxID=2835040 RepID=A0ABS5Q926_9PROT|nr:FMN-binding negative transcriptional regulator [Roseococcus pinisoli]MBS7810009.1 FMN-binding negative transcriptional regulator [Roseococcus pinisoli]
MPVYNPPAFREDRPEVLLRLMQQSGLCLLVSNGRSGVPDITHLPLQTNGKIVVGHMARANPHWKALREAGRAIAVFPGPDGYISPNSYPSKAENHRAVPTWNYETVHAEGPIEIVEDAGRLRDIVTALTDQHEAGSATPWSVSDAPADYLASQLKGIVGVVLTVETLTGKRKLSQNRNEADREGARIGLGGQNEALVQAMLRSRDGD